MLFHLPMRNLALVLAGLAGACSSAQMQDPEPVDAARIDAPPSIDGSVADAPAPDAPTPDAAAPDASSMTDAAIDGGAPCPISTGQTITLDGAGDLAEYPASQRMFPGAQVAAADEVAITWDPTYLYVTVRSEAFSTGDRPFHLYLETGTALLAPQPSRGKEYSQALPYLPFTGTQLIAIRGTSDFGTGPYNGVYMDTAAQPWTTQTMLLDRFVSSDLRTLSTAVPWTALGGCPTTMRLALHVVNGSIGMEWKDLVPTTHTPWMSPGGGYYEISLTGSPAISGWALH